MHIYDSEHTYNLSFVAGTAMVNETVAVAEAYLESGKDWNVTKERTFTENLLEKEKVSTIKRVFALVKQRLEALNAPELEMLVTGNPAVRRLLILLAICKAHLFIYDFLADSVRESFYNLSETVTHADFNRFYNDKRFEHPEIEAITEKTLQKVRQCIFRILEQTEIIDYVATCNIRRPYLPALVEELIVKDDPRWLAAFLYSESEINNARLLYE